MMMKKKAATSFVALLRLILAPLWFSSQVCEGFVKLTSSPCSPRHSEPPSFFASDITYAINPSRTQLFLQQNNTTPSKLERNAIEEIIPDRYLLACDCIAIAIASQLIGLLDIVNDPNFASAGGWLQPIPAVPSTLGVLVTRTASLILIWLGTGLTVVPVISKGDRLFSEEAVDTDEHAIGNALKAATAFSVVRISLGILLGGVDDPNGLGSLARDCYFVALTVTAFRFLYGQYFR